MTFTHSLSCSGMLSTWFISHYCYLGSFDLIYSRYIHHFFFIFILWNIVLPIFLFIKIHSLYMFNKIGNFFLLEKILNSYMRCILRYSESYSKNYSIHHQICNGVSHILWYNILTYFLKTCDCLEQNINQNTFWKYSSSYYNFPTKLFISCLNSSFDYVQHIWWPFSLKKTLLNKQVYSL